MSLSGVTDALSDDWEYVATESLEERVAQAAAADDSDGGTTTIDDLVDAEELTATVARHTSSAELTLRPPSGLMSHAWIAGLVQYATADGYTAAVQTHLRMYDSVDTACAFLRTLGEQVTAGEEAIDALAIIPHAGDIESVSLDGLTTDTDALSHELADVFAVRSAELPAGFSVDELRSEREAIIRFVYGRTDGETTADGTRPAVPDILQEISSENEALGYAPIHVFTVTADDLQPVDATDG